MNIKNCNIKKTESNDESYFLSIKDNKTGITEEMYLSDLEFKILNLAVQHNKGIINLLSNTETIYGLFQKGLVTISKDKLGLAVVSEVIAYLLNPKTTEDMTDNPFEEENKPNGFFKTFKNKDICFCCLCETVKK
ncbi:MAG TPA: hypothetical protein VLL98_04080 [Rickettsiales bacterium]|nr:hypothetical protein [Rickettsiales bacterium]